MTAVVGVLFADYYLLRKRRVHVHDLYEMNGQYHYWKGINFAGFIAWIVGGAVANMLSAYSSIVGFIVGAALYYVLAKYWWFRMYPQAEINDPSDEKYLGITAGNSWTIDENDATDAKVVDGMVEQL